MANPLYPHQTVDRRKELAQPGPQAEILGTVANDLIAEGPQRTDTMWASDGGAVELSEPPPPWELDGGGEEMASDARRYVDVPLNWTLHWINPRLLESTGWRHWEPVLASDTRVRVRVKQMAAPDGTIRRGGPATGDILAWMYTSWVESRRRLLAKKTAELTESAVRKQQELRDEFRRGTYGPSQLDEARHPAYTIADGRSMKD